MCRCSCGIEKVVLEQRLKNGESGSCGHRISELRTSHGERKLRTPEYAAWTCMKQRCLNPKARGYKYWGGRGIVICKSWVDSYESFLKDVGRRPSSKHSLHRLDNEGMYEPSNVCWALPSIQNRNKRNSRKIVIDGRSANISDLSIALGGNRNLIGERIKNGWNVNEAATMQPTPNHPHVLRSGLSPLTLQANGRAYKMRPRKCGKPKVIGPLD